MNTEVLRFGALLQKEWREHRNLFWITPAVVGLFLLLIFFLLVIGPLQNLGQSVLQEAGSLLGNPPLRSAVAIPLMAALVFTPAAFLNTVIYLTVCLYQDRKDRSFLFWQSMPVSDWQAVLARAVTAVFVIPAFFIPFVLLCLLAPLLYLTPAMADAGVGFALGKALLLGLNASVLFWCFVWLNGLLMLPVFGWLLLFSAYSRRVPFLWALGGIVIVALLEAWLLDSIWFLYWMSWTTRVMVFGYGDVPTTLFSYEMLVALVLGGVLLAGAALMRRFND